MSDSPYQTSPAFAGNPLLISPEELYVSGYLAKSDLEVRVQFPTERIDFASVIQFKTRLLERAFSNFRHTGTVTARDEFPTFATSTTTGSTSMHCSWR